MIEWPKILLCRAGMVHDVIQLSCLLESLLL